LAALTDWSLLLTRTAGLLPRWRYIKVLTAVAQAVVVALTGSVALLADTIHNFSDALTAVPLWIAFVLGRRAASRRYTYGYGRSEDLAGLRAVPGVVDVEEMRLRWVGRRVRAETGIVVEPSLGIVEAHDIATTAKHSLLHDVPRLVAATVHVSPRDTSGHDHHACLPITPTRWSQAPSRDTPSASDKHRPAEPFGQVLTALPARQPPCLTGPERQEHGPVAGEQVIWSAGRGPRHRAQTRARRAATAIGARGRWRREEVAHLMERHSHRMQPAPPSAIMNSRRPARSDQLPMDFDLPG